jgi:uncharacterized membrane protein (GlpM family)
VDADAGLEIVAGGSYFDGLRDVAQLSVWTGSTLAFENVQVWYWTGNTAVNSVAVANVDADAGLEIVAGGSYFDGLRDVAQLSVWTGSTLAFENVQVWYWTGNTAVNSVAVANVDADAGLEIVAGGSYFDGLRDVAQLSVWTGSTLAFENVQVWYSTGDTTINSVAIANIDADVAIEIITGGTFNNGVSNAQVATWTGSSLASETINTWQSGTATYVKSVVPLTNAIVSGGYFNDGIRLNAEVRIL